MPSSGAVTEGAQDFSGAKTFQAGLGAGQHRTQGLIAANTVSTGNGADQTEDILQSFVLPANSLSANGKGVRVRAWGTTAANADNKQVKLYFGASVLASGVAAANNVAWNLEIVVLRTAAGAQSVIGGGNFNAASVSPAYTSGTDDETTALTIKCTGQDSTASSANAIVCKGMIVEFLN